MNALATVGLAFAMSTDAMPPESPCWLLEHYPVEARFDPRPACSMASCAREKFLSALPAVAGIVERRHTLPILTNVLIRMPLAAL